MKTALFFFLCLIFLNSDAQKLLEIDVYQSETNLNNNYYKLDGQFQEYGSLNTPTLYLVVIDTLTCKPWYTIYQEQDIEIGHDLFNLNSFCTQHPPCRTRQERYFIYFQNDSTQLNGLNRAINDSIANGQLFFIYAPIEYDFNQILASSPALASTLINYGGVSAGQNHAISLLVAKKGVPESYHYEFNENVGSEIHYSDTICRTNILSTPQLSQSNFSIQQIDENTYKLSGKVLSNLELFNVLGQNIDFTILDTSESSILVQITNYSNELLIFKTNQFSTLFFKN